MSGGECSGSGRVEALGAGERLIVARLAGELAIKARRTRGEFRRRLVGNVKDALSAAGVRFSLRREPARLIVRADRDSALPTLGRVFGLGSISPVDAVCEGRIEPIVASGARIFADRVAGRRFAVRARTPGAGPSSREIEVRLGAELGRRAPVDLTDPEITVRVEVFDGTARLFSERRPGAGGLPLGSAGRGVALLSGGFDSPVAAWMMMRRGLALDFVFGSLAGPEHDRAVLGLAKLLADAWAHGDRPRIHVLPLAPLVEAIRRRTDDGLQQVLLKRLLYRAAERIARTRGASAIITGESLGQVSSQTLDNLAAIESGAALPVLRPLLGLDKMEIIERSRAIGTHDLSAKLPETCDLNPRRPAIAAAASEIDAAVERLGRAALDGLVVGARVVDLRRTALGALGRSAPTIDRVPDGALVVDLRSPAAFARGHLPGAIPGDADAIAADPAALPPGRTLVLVCEVGARSAALAERLRELGIDAWALRATTAR